MTALAGSPIARDPLALAALYHAGLGSSWKTKREAVVAFARFSPKVTHEALSRAVAVSKMPPQVLGLFETAGMWPETARHLIRLTRKHGVDTVCQRAEAIDPLGRSWMEIIRLLDGQDGRPPERVYSTVSPLALATEYRRGLEEGRWTSSVTAVAASPTWDINRISLALAISNLPPPVLELFDAKRITYDLGAVLIKICKTVGEHETVARAQKMLSAPRRRTKDQIIAGLLKVRPEQGVDLAVRKQGESMVFEFKVKLAETDDLLLSTDELAALVQVAVMNLRFKRQVGTVSVRK